jgi:hypothetical protein
MINKCCGVDPVFEEYSDSERYPISIRCKTCNDGVWGIDKDQLIIDWNKVHPDVSRNCIMCKYWWLDHGQERVSTGCERGKWFLNNANQNILESDWRDKIKAAGTCEHFVEAKG